MAFSYSPLAATAASLIRQFGAQAQLHNETGSSMGKVSAVFVTNSNANKANPTGAGGSFIQAQDNEKELLIAATKTPPVTGWTVTVEKQAYRVVGVEALKPASVVLYYKLRVVV